MGLKPWRGYDKARIEPERSGPMVGELSTKQPLCTLGKDVVPKFSSN